jgi:photosystem II stability/assembly factor-like uncharacterized protein
MALANRLRRAGRLRHAGGAGQAPDESAAGAARRQAPAAEGDLRAGLLPGRRRHQRRLLRRPPRSDGPGDTIPPALATAASSSPPATAERTWSLQFGDRNSATGAIARLFFVDATHGWAEQVDGTLLRTTDGTRWTVTGTVDPLSQIAFVTPEKGFSLKPGQGIQATADGGRTWRLVYLCDPQAIAFAPDGTTGYAIGRAPGSRRAVIAKSTDAGERWTTVGVLPDTNVSDVSLAFSDSSSGYLRAGAVLKMTSDGGRTWRAAPVSVPYDTSKLGVAGEVAWIIGSRAFTYTLDGGVRWFERKVDFRRTSSASRWSRRIPAMSPAVTG